MPRTRYGAKGISLFIPCFLEKITKVIPTTAPIQKANTTPESARDKPSNQPKLIANLASPKPIQRPEETSQNKAKGAAIKRPKANSQNEGMCKKKPELLKKNNPTKVRTAKNKERMSGIILCLKS